MNTANAGTFADTASAKTYPTTEGSLAIVCADGPRPVERLAVVRVDGRAYRPLKSLQLLRRSNYDSRNQTYAERITEVRSTGRNRECKGVENGQNGNRYFFTIVY